MMNVEITDSPDPSSGVNPGIIIGEGCYQGGLGGVEYPSSEKGIRGTSPEKKL